MNDSNASTDEVVIERTFDAPIDLVWKMWTDPEHFKALVRPGGRINPGCPDGPAGRWNALVCMEMQFPTGPMQMWFVGEYREIVVNERLVYTESMSDEHGNVKSPAEMGMPAGHPTTTEVRVDLRATDDRTQMIMTHVGIPSDSPGAVGWTMAFDKLTSYLAQNPSTDS